MRRLSCRASTNIAEPVAVEVSGAPSTTAPPPFSDTRPLPFTFEAASTAGETFGVTAAFSDLLDVPPFVLLGGEPLRSAAGIITRARR